MPAGPVLIRGALSLLLASILALTLAASGSSAPVKRPPKCTRAAVKAVLGRTIQTVNSITCRGGFAAGSATTKGYGGFDFNYVVRARRGRWVKASCGAKGLPPRLRRIACTSS